MLTQSLREIGANHLYDDFEHRALCVQKAETISAFQEWI
jgi:hypothetical protein